MRLLVYGTLMDTWINQERTTVKGRLFDIGPHPGLIIGEGNTEVECAIINVNKYELEELDFYESTEMEYYTREKTGIDDIEYYRPRGALSPMVGVIYELLSKEPINWMEYKLGESKNITIEVMGKKELTRLVESRQ